MRIKPPLILHAGMPKTGTSAIQNSLSSEAWGGPWARLRAVTVPVRRNTGD